jgi:hypothetical protein
MFSSLGNLVTRLLGGTNEMQQDSIGTILNNMIQAKNHSWSDSPAIASAGSAWVSWLTVQLNTQQERWRMRKEGGNGSLSSCC